MCDSYVGVDSQFCETAYDRFMTNDSWPL